MSDKRIIDLPTLQTALGNDAWLVVDIESGATYKIKKSALLGLQSLETQSQEVYGAINEVRSLAEDLVSDEYDATSAYAKGDYCIYNNTLYKCTTAIATGGEAWNASHWSATKCDSELSELKGTLANKEWTRILNETASSRNYDETKSIDTGKLFSQYSELMFVMMNANNLRIMGTTIVPVGAFQNGAVYVLGAGDIGADYLYNAVFIYASDSTVEIAIGAKSGNPIASYVFRIYAR